VRVLIIIKKFYTHTHTHTHTHTEREREREREIVYLQLIRTLARLDDARRRELGCAHARRLVTEHGDVECALYVVAAPATALNRHHETTALRGGSLNVIQGQCVNRSLFSGFKQ